MAEQLNYVAELSRAPKYLETGVAGWTVFCASGSNVSSCEKCLRCLGKYSTSQGETHREKLRTDMSFKKSTDQVVLFHNERLLTFGYDGLQP